MVAYLYWYRDIYILISFTLGTETSNTDKSIVVTLAEHLTSKDVSQPLGRGLTWPAWPARWLVGGTVGHKSPSKNDSRVAKSNGGKGKMQP